MKKPVIAIDGFSSTGKSSVSKEIAQRLSIIHLDTGALYRAVTYFALKNYFYQDQINTEKLIGNLSKIHIELKAKENQFTLLLNGEEISEKIRTNEVSNWVSLIAKIPEIRDFLLHTQRNIAQKGGVILDGRDIGTNVLPNADYKFFLTASIEKRTERRFKELQEMGQNTSLQEVKENLILRDKIDSEREIAPLKKAPDAIIIDNTDIDQEATILEILSHIRKID